LRWIDEPSPRGLDPLVAQLVVAVFAEQTDRAFYLHGSEVVPPPEPGRITPDYRLREQPLPEEKDWAEARARAAALFGVHAIALRRGRLVAMFGRDVTAEAQRYRHAARELVSQLEQHAVMLGIDPQATSGRLATARAAADLLDALAERRPAKEIVELLAHADLPGPADRVGRSITSAAKVSETLANAGWDTFELISKLPAPHDREAEAILARLRDAARADELTSQLAPALEQAKNDGTKLLARAIEKDQDDDPDQLPTILKGSRKVAADDVNPAVEELRAFAEKHPGTTIEVTWRVLP